MRLIGLDYLFWSAIHVARDQVIKVVLATPPQLLADASWAKRARVDRYGTYASARYTAGQIDGAKFIGFDQGGHILVGHDDEVHAAIVKLLFPARRP